MQVTNSNNTPPSSSGWPGSGSQGNQGSQGSTGGYGNHRADDQNHTLAYPSQPGQTGQPGHSAWGAPQGAGQGSPKKSGKGSGKGWKIALAVIAVIVVLFGLGEFGARTYFANQITNSVKEEAQKNGTQIESDPKVSFGSSPVLLALVTGTIGSMDLQLPSTLNISYQGADKSKPIVKGYPAVHIDAHNLKPSDNGDDMTMGEVTIDTSVPNDLMLAQAQKSTEQSTGDLGFLSGLLRVTDIQPNLERQTMEFQIGGGLATLQMKPVVSNGNLMFDMDSAQILGQNLPQQFVDQLKGSLAGTTVAAVGGLNFEKVSVTQTGLEVTLHGTNVDMNEVGKAFDEQAGNAQSNGAQRNGNQPAQRTQSSPTPNPYDQSGAVGSS